MDTRTKRQKLLDMASQSDASPREAAIAQQKLDELDQAEDDLLESRHDALVRRVAKIMDVPVSVIGSAMMPRVRAVADATDELFVGGVSWGSPHDWDGVE